MLLLQYTASLPRGSGQWNSCHALPHCLWAVGSATLQCIAPLPGASGHCNSHNTVPHCLGAVGSGTAATRRLAAWGQWAVELL